MSVACPDDSRYLYQSSNPGVVEYLCNRLFDLSESALDAYLLQLVYLAVAKPGGTLERTLVELASRSFKLALKVLKLSRHRMLLPPRHAHAHAQHAWHPLLCWVSEGQSWAMPWSGCKAEQ